MYTCKVPSHCDTINEVLYYLQHKRGHQWNVLDNHGESLTFIVDSVDIIMFLQSTSLIVKKYDQKPLQRTKFIKNPQEKVKTN